MEVREKEETVVKDSQKETEEDNIFETEEIIIEEMAINGICGVY